MRDHCASREADLAFLSAFDFHSFLFTLNAKLTDLGQSLILPNFYEITYHASCIYAEYASSVYVQFYQLLDI